MDMKMNDVRLEITIKDGEGGYQWWKRGDGGGERHIWRWWGWGEWDEIGKWGGVVGIC